MKFLAPLLAFAAIASGAETWATEPDMDTYMDALDADTTKETLDVTIAAGLTDPATTTSKTYEQGAYVTLSITDMNGAADALSKKWQASNPADATAPTDIGTVTTNSGDAADAYKSFHVFQIPADAAKDTVYTLHFSSEPECAQSVLTAGTESANCVGKYAVLEITVSEAAADEDEEKEEDGGSNWMMILLAIVAIAAIGAAAFFFLM